MAINSPSITVSELKMGAAIMACYFDEYDVSILTLLVLFVRGKTEVPKDVRNSKIRKQDKFRRDWSQY